MNSTRPENTNFNSSAEVDGDKILEGSEVHFRCDADANPSDINYRWFINDELVVGDYTTEMVIYHFVYFVFHKFKGRKKNRSNVLEVFDFFYHIDNDFFSLILLFSFITLYLTSGNLFGESNTS